MICHEGDDVCTTCRMVQGYYFIEMMSAKLPDEEEDWRTSEALYCLSVVDSSLKGAVVVVVVEEYFQSYLRSPH